MTGYSIAWLRRAPKFFLFLFVFILLFTLPASAQLKGTTVEVRGEASVVIFDDVLHDRSEIRYYLIDSKQKERRLHFRGGPPDSFKTGRKFKIRGRSGKDGIEVDSLAELDGSASGQGEESPAEAALAPPETRRILTLLVDFNDAAVSGGNYGTNVQAVRDRMYNETKSVAGLFFNASLGTLTFDPDGDGDGQQDVFHVAINDSYIGGDAAQCDPSEWVSKASTAWQQANPGKNIGIYRHRLLITPNYYDYGNRHCGWGGVAQVGCGSWCWAIGADPQSIMHGVIVHELGHNLGFNHARTDTDNNGSYESEYGDNSDMMGLSRNWKKFNAPHAEDKGWIDPVDYEIREVVAGVGPQTFDLLPMDDEAWYWPGLRALRLERSGSSDYYVSFRRAAGDYDNLNSEYRDRVNVHWSPLGSTYSYFVTALAAGESFTDPARDLVITATSPVTVTQGAESTVAMGVQVCQQTCSSTPPPTNLTASAQATDAILLGWSDNSSDEDGFDIQRSPDGNAWSAVTTEAPNATSWLDTGLSSGTEYFYRVRASAAAGDSDWSNVASASTLGLPPAADFGFVDNYLQVDFSDLSTDPDGSVVFWSWDFGDGGASSAQNPSHVYASGGTRTVTLEVTDEDGYSDSTARDVTVFEPPNSPPTADFTFSVDDLAVAFSDASTDSDGSVTAWSWDFGDGNGASGPDPVHAYSTGGDYTVILTVTDDDGDQDSVSQVVTVVAPPPYTDYPATAESAVAGSVSGSLVATAADDGVAQSITERESGGRKSDRHSYLEHRWSFDIPAGDAATLMVNAWRSASTDGDSFDFAWSANGGPWQALATVSNLTDDTPLSFELPAGVSGSIELRVTDTDRQPGNRDLDTVFVDYLQIRVANGTPEPFDSDAPTGLTAQALSHSSIELSWTDNGGNEAGFSVERSAGGGFVEVATTGPNGGAAASYTDTGLAGDTTYTYRVRAFNGDEYSGYSNESSATTGPAPAMSLSAQGYKEKGSHTVDLAWSGAGSADVDIYRDDVLQTTTANDGSHTDAIGAKGSASYRYRVCETGSTSACSGEETVVF